MTIALTPRRFAWMTVALAVLTAVAAVQASLLPKIGFYLNQFERTGLLYIVAPLVIVSLFVVLKYPRLSLYVMMFLIAFHPVGGVFETETVFISVAKIAVMGGVVAALLSTLLAPERDRAWILDSAVGQTLLFWVLLVGVATVVGFFTTPNRGDWVRESSWMLFYAGALPAGTLLRTRRDVTRLLAWGGAGAAILQIYAFYDLATGRRFIRSDFEGWTFYRAPFPAISIFYLYFCIALYLVDRAERGVLTRAQRIAALIALVALTAGLLATMGRGLWISGALGLLPLLALVPWNRRTIRAALLAAGAIAAAVAVVVTVDSLSAQSGGNWTRTAWEFLLNLTEKDAVSIKGRQLEWVYARDAWMRSPLLGLGFGYPFPDNPYNNDVPDAFYIHNSYMNVLAKAGAFGLLALLAAFAAVLVCAVKNARDPRADGFERALAIALFAGIMQMGIVGAFVPFVTTTDSVLGLAIQMGLVAAQRRQLAARVPG